MLSLNMKNQVSLLSKAFAACFTEEWLFFGVWDKVILKISNLVEGLSTVIDETPVVHFEWQFLPFDIERLEGFVPSIRNVSNASLAIWDRNVGLNGFSFGYFFIFLHDLSSY